MSAARLLGGALSFAATLAPRYERDFILANISTVARQIARYDAMIERCRAATPGNYPAVQGLEEITEFVDAVGADRAVFAVSQLGAAMLCTPALAATGVKIACVYRRINATVREILEAGGAVLLDLEAADGRSLLRRLATMQKAGYAAALIVEAPTRSRRRYSFMGYDVCCSSLLELYATSLNKSVLPLASCITAPDELQMIAGEPLALRGNLTQTLLHGLEDLITR